MTARHTALLTIPIRASTLSCLMSFVAFCTPIPGLTASSVLSFNFLPKQPPAAFISSMAMEAPYISYSPMTDKKPVCGIMWPILMGFLAAFAMTGANIPLVPAITAAVPVVLRKSLLVHPFWLWTPLESSPFFIAFLLSFQKPDPDFCNHMSFSIIIFSRYHLPCMLTIASNNRGELLCFRTFAL